MRFFTYIVLISLLFRSFIPAGYMPDVAGKKHFFNVIICTGYGAQTLTVDEDGQPVKKDQQKQTGHKAVCPFALNTAADAPADAMIQGAMPIEYTALLFTAPAAHPATATLRKTAPPRAPPLSPEASILRLSVSA